MASVLLSGVLNNSFDGEFDVGGVLTFTHITATGTTLPTTRTELIVRPDGVYSFGLNYGYIRIDYATKLTSRFIGNVLVDSNTTATSIPELLNASVPVKDPVIIEMEDILGDATTAKTGAETARDDAENFSILAENFSILAETFANQLTTTELIASTAVFALDIVVPSVGYSASGDGGSAQWKQNGVTGETPSQSPMQLGANLLNDGNGNQWEKVIEGFTTQLPDVAVSLPMGNKIVGTLSGALEFSRTSTSGNINKSGQVESLLIDDPAISINGISIYTAYSNFFETPTTPVTQVATIAAGIHTLWVVGTGSAITSHGTATDGNPLSFTSAGESLTVTISGALELCNLIDLYKVAPPILEDAVPTLRAEDDLSFPSINNLPPNGMPFTIVVDVDVPLEAASVFSVDGFSFNMWRYHSTSSLIFDFLTGLRVPYDNTIGLKRYCLTYDGSVMSVYADGIFYDSASYTGELYDLLSPVLLGQTRPSGGNERKLNSEIKNFKIYHSALSATQITYLGSAE